MKLSRNLPLVQICSDLLVCSVSRRKQKIMTDQMSVCSGRRRSAWAEGSHLHQTGWRHTTKLCTHVVRNYVLASLRLQLPYVDGALVVVDVLGGVVVVGVCYDGCEQSAVHCATAVLGRVGRAWALLYISPTWPLQPIR